MKLRSSASVFLSDKEAKTATLGLFSLHRAVLGKSTFCLHAAQDTRVTWSHMSFVIVLTGELKYLTVIICPLGCLHKPSANPFRLCSGRSCSSTTIFFTLAFLNMGNYRLLNVNIHFLTPMKHSDLGSFPVVCLDNILRLSFSA